MYELTRISAAIFLCGCIEELRATKVAKIAMNTPSLILDPQEILVQLIDCLSN